MCFGSRFALRYLNPMCLFLPCSLQGSKSLLKDKAGRSFSKAGPKVALLARGKRATERPLAVQSGQEREREGRGHGREKLPGRIRVLACGRFIRAAAREQSRLREHHVRVGSKLPAADASPTPNPHTMHPVKIPWGEGGLRKLERKASVSLGGPVWPEGQSPTEETEWPFSRCPPMFPHPTSCT